MCRLTVVISMEHSACVIDLILREVLSAPFVITNLIVHSDLYGDKVVLYSLYSWLLTLLHMSVSWPFNDA